MLGLAGDLHVRPLRLALAHDGAHPLALDSLSRCPVLLAGKLQSVARGLFFAERISFQLRNPALANRLLEADFVLCTTTASGPKKTLAGRWTQRADGFRSTPVRSTPPDGPFGRKPTLTRAPDVERPDFTADQRRDRDDPGCLLERCGLVPLIGREALRADRLPFPSQGSPLPRSDRRTGRSGSPNTRRCRSRDRSSSTG